LVKNTNKGTTSNANGEFNLPITTGDKTIVISLIGFETQEHSIEANKTYNISLQKDNKQLTEVVVMGYSTQTKKSVTGAASTIKGAAIQNIPAAGFNQLLQGKTTGVQITSNSGTPGGGIFIRVRGTNSVNADNEPLYILDGVFINNRNLVSVGLGNQVQSNPLADINPNDIESIQVLKDANATAIYGSRGANGVIIITTKRGRANTKSKVSFNTYQGWAKAANIYKVASGQNIAILENERYINDGGDPATVPFRLASTGGRGTPEEQPTYDRINDLFQTANTANHEISVSGGAEKTNYYIGLGYFDQEAIVKPTKFKRYSGRFNFDHFVNNALKIGTSTTIAKTYRNVSSNDNNPAGVINSALYPRTYLPVFNANGTYAKYGNFDNHLALINELNNNADGWRVISNVYGEYNFLPYLKIRSSWSVDFNDLYENNFNNTLLLAGQPRGTASSVLSRDVTLLNEQVLSYVRTIDRHAINALAGNTLQQNTFQRTALNGQQFPNNDLTTIASAATQTGSSSKAEARLVSFFGKASYTFNDKYSIDASLRADASSRFGANNKWGYFPSVGAAWRLGKEAFIQNLNLFDELKVCASWGKTGNQNGISEYASLGLWQGGSNYLDLPGTAPFQLANPDLSWETTRQVNVGVDFSVLKSRLNVEINYYDKYTYGLLLNVPVPRRSGYTSIVQNYGAVSNKGFELGINTINIHNKAFQWTTDFNVSTNKNTIEKLAAPITAGSRDIVRLEEGKSLYAFWLYNQLYVDPNSGNAVYEDVNKDGNITVADRQIVGDAWPDFQGGITNTLSYKGVDLSLFFYFEQGAKIMNMNRYFLVHGGTQSNIGYFDEQLERWQKPGDVTDIPRLTTNPVSNNYGGTVQNLSTRYLEDGSFVRLRTLTLGYSIPKQILSSIRLSAARIYVLGSNLWTLTNYSGLDPEVNSQSTSGNTKNFDWATVPQPRSIQVGLNVTF
jgi:TonB-linked SusC/RagA family outer membrane protein